MKISFAYWVVMALLAVGDLQAAPWTLSCPDKIKKLPRLAVDKGTLEPSGVIWDPVNKVAIGVSDEAAPHALFAFDPAQGRGGKTIQATPLLTEAEVKKQRPKDMEAITRLASGEFVATASHSLKNGKPQDTMLRFRLKKGAAANQPWEIEALQRIPPTAEGFRSWLIQTANPPWDKKRHDQEGESGINLEGLAASSQGDLLHLGFRGPIEGGEIPVLTFRIDGEGKPAVVKWHTLKLDKKFEVGGILGMGTEPMGIRDMTAIPGMNGQEFLLLIGASGSGSDQPFQIGWWRDDQHEITLVGKIAKGFRAEGLTVVSQVNNTLDLLLVSDKSAQVMECQAVRKGR